MKRPRRSASCPVPGCPEVTDGGRCERHRRELQVEQDERRPSSHARGYGRDHQALRDSVRGDVAAGVATCWRCGNPILPGEPWDLGHDDHDRTIYRGPEHARCNRATRARLARKETVDA